MECGVGFDDALLRDDVHDPGQASSAVAAMLDGHAPPTAGRRAAEVLFRRVAGDGSSPEQIMLPTELRHVRLTS